MSNTNGKSDPLKDMKEMAAQLAPLATLTATYYKQLVAEGVPRADALRLAESLIDRLLTQAQQNKPPIPPVISFARDDSDA